MFIIPRYSKLTARSIHKTKKIISFLPKVNNKSVKAKFLFIGKIALMKRYPLFCGGKNNVLSKGVRSIVPVFAKAGKSYKFEG